MSEGLVVYFSLRFEKDGEFVDSGLILGWIFFLWFFTVGIRFLIRRKVEGKDLF